MSAARRAPSSGRAPLPTPQPDPVEGAETVAHPLDAQDEVYQALCAHFDRTHEYVEVPEIMEMTGLDENAVTNALRVLHQEHSIEGITAAEVNYPFRVTAVLYD